MNIRHPLCRFFTLILGVLSLTAQPWAQRNNWNAVRQLRQGTAISVKVRFRLQCNFRYADDQQLICDQRAQGRFLRPPLIFSRAQIHQVRIERADASMAAGAAIGAGAGATVGATSGNGTLTRGGSTLLGAGIGGLIGGAFGKQFPLIHGEVVYQRP